MPKYPADLLTLIASLKKLPGVGGRTAERFAFHMLDWAPHQLSDLAKQIGSIKEKIKQCPDCGCLREEKGCSYCDPSQRDGRQLCVLASPKDVFAIEETHSYFGYYHVLGGLLSPLDGRDCEHLHVDKLKKRIESLQIQEVILAIDSTLEGDATALYLKEQLTAWGIKLSRLAFGIPMGSSLDFVDGGTLMRALTGRQSI